MILRYRITAKSRGYLQRLLAECALTCLPDRWLYARVGGMFPNEKPDPRRFIRAQTKSLIDHDRHMRSVDLFEQAWCDEDIPCPNCMQGKGKCQGPFYSPNCRCFVVKLKGV